jgi:hypothetical protein
MAITGLSSSGVMMVRIRKFRDAKTIAAINKESAR